jgi:hypothetical protein
MPRGGIDGQPCTNGAEVEGMLIIDLVVGGGTFGAVRPGPVAPFPFGGYARVQKGGRVAITAAHPGSPEGLLRAKPLAGDPGIAANGRVVAERGS